MRAVVLVLGDLGRSPRMLAHAASLLHAGHDVHLVGGTRTPLPPALANASRLHVHGLELGAPRAGGVVAASVATGVRGLRLAWRLLRVLMADTPAPHLLLVQTPPALPTLPVALAAARLRGAALIVDWHNLGWTLLALKFREEHPLVRLTRWAERFFGARADGHLAVSQRLAAHLRSLGFTDVAVLHDGPTAARPFPPARDDLPANPVVVVAPMGWTRDDDLPLLHDALTRLARQLQVDPSPRRTLRLRVTGDGPLRPEWGERLRALGGGAIAVETPDVESHAYPELLATSHLGLCVHRSSSRLDLPMKVVELQTVGVPILALSDGSPLEEIAPPESGVATFATAEALAQQLFEALSPPGESTDLLAQLTRRARRYRPVSWDERWAPVMSALLPPAT